MRQRCLGRYFRLAWNAAPTAPPNGTPIAIQIGFWVIAKITAPTMIPKLTPYATGRLLSTQSLGLCEGAISPPIGSIDAND